MTCSFENPVYGSILGFEGQLAVLIIAEVKP
jgi:hypothetical protein